MCSGGIYVTITPCIVMLPPDWLPTIIEVVAIGVGLVFFILHWHVRNVLHRIRFAKMLLADLDVMYETMRVSKNILGSGKDIFLPLQVGPHTTQPRTLRDVLLPLQKSGYEGLANSGGISYLSHKLQKDVHHLHRAVDSYNRKLMRESDPDVLRPFYRLPGSMSEPMEASLENLIKSVKKFIKENECNKRWLLKLFRAYDGD